MFDLAPVDSGNLFGEVEIVKKKQIELRGITRRARISAHRAASTDALAKILPKPEIGNSYHVISSGDIDSLSFLEHVLKFYDLDYLILSTWCMAGEDVAQLENWLNTGKIKRLDAYCGEIFPNQYPNIHADLFRIVRPGGGAAAFFAITVKFFQVLVRKFHLLLSRAQTSTPIHELNKARST